MSFKIGDNVIYGGNGVCKITDIKKMSFFNEPPKDYYILESCFIKQASTMYVPLDNEIMVSRMQDVMTKEEATELIKVLTDCKTEWIEDKNVRKSTFNNIIVKGTREEIMTLIKTILNHQAEIAEEGKRLNLQDEKALSEAMDRINNEFALVFDMDPKDVPDFVREKAYGKK
ncbi:MAG: CarD family transcriptional regulator [Clostridia bacterium]|nr:CarD family transcriptional regulator [Clostridia bacterium]